MQNFLLLCIKNLKKMQKKVMFFLVVHVYTCKGANVNLFFFFFTEFE